MTHRCLIAWVLLSLVALRGLVPAGYMLDADADGLSIVICHSGMYRAALSLEPSQHAQHNQHHRHQGHQSHLSQHDPGAPSHDEHGSGSQDHSICPFAIASGGVSPDVVAFAVPYSSGQGVRSVSTDAIA